MVVSRVRPLWRSGRHRIPDAGADSGRSYRCPRGLMTGNRRRCGIRRRRTWRRTGDRCRIGRWCTARGAAAERDAGAAVGNDQTESVIGELAAARLAAGPGGRRAETAVCCFPGRSSKARSLASQPASPPASPPASEPARQPASPPASEPARQRAIPTPNARCWLASPRKGF